MDLGFSPGRKNILRLLCVSSAHFCLARITLNLLRRQVLHDHCISVMHSRLLIFIENLHFRQSSFCPPDRWENERINCALLLMCLKLVLLEDAGKKEVLAMVWPRPLDTTSVELEDPLVNPSANG